MGGRRDYSQPGRAAQTRVNPECGAGASKAANGAAAPHGRDEFMRRLRSNLISLLCTLAIAMPLIACGHPLQGHAFAGFRGGAVSLKNGSVLIKVKGRDTAHVDGEGRLRRGDEEVKLTPAAQAALRRYNDAAQGFSDQALKLGLDSADFALHTVGQVFAGLLDGGTDQASREAERGGEAIKTKARALCATLQGWKQAQDAAAAAAPEFRPYAVIAEDDVQGCYVDDGKPGHGPDGTPQIAS
jgi:hypothetical protein